MLRFVDQEAFIPKHIEALGVTVIDEDVRKSFLQWCDANVLRIQLERQNTKYIPSLREYTNHFGINKELLESINKEILIFILAQSIGA